MEQFQTYLLLFAVVVVVGQIFNKSVIPISLLLVITGMFLSFIPAFPHLDLNPGLVLNIFLPMLVYQISTNASWADMKRFQRPIALLSVGHVVFITCLVAVVIHTLIPDLGWPLSFVLGAVISPPDDVADRGLQLCCGPRKNQEAVPGEASPGTAECRRSKFTSLI